MKHLLIILLSLTVITSCTKDPAKKAFLMGRLIDNCNGAPVANEKVFFYKNFEAGGTSVFSLDKPESLLEEVTTNDEGYFYFTGEGYANKATSTFYGASIRLTNGTRLAEGILGEGEDAESSESHIKNVGDLIYNGMSIDISAQISNLNGLTSYDSVIVYGIGEQGLYLNNPISNSFNIPVTSTTVFKKQFWMTTDPNYGKYELPIDMYFYNNEDFKIKEVGYYYFDQCTATADVVFEF